MCAVLGVADLLQGLAGPGMHGLRQGVDHVPGFVNPAPLMSGLR
jgi:hypothetical protein